MKSGGQNMEAVLQALGGRGKFQIINHLLLAFTYVIIIFNHVLMAFHGTPVPHTCVPDFDKDESRKNGFSYSVREKNLSMTTSTSFGKCASTRYYSNGQNLTLHCQSGQWNYTPKDQVENIVSEFDLVCDDKTLAGWATTIYFAGVMVGGIVFGDLGDRFGRLPVLIFSMFASFAVGIGGAFSVNYLMFVLLRFLNGIFMQGIQTSSYTLIMELFEARYRPYAGAVTEIYLGCGVISLGILAFIFRDWRHLQIAVSVPSFFAILYVFFTPESLRWLIAKGKMDRAEKVIDRICKVNRVPYPQAELNQLKESSDIGAAPLSPPQEYNLTYLFRTPKLRLRSCVLFYIWFVISTSYYGVTFKMSMFKINRYLMFVIGGTIETIIYALSLPIMNKFGRKKPLFVSFLIAAVMCIASGFVNDFDEDQHLATAILALIGRGALACLFGVIFVYTTELYPTVIRNIGMGACCFFARLGGVCAPQINLWAKGTAGFDAIIVFGCLCLLAVFLVIPLLETHNTKLPDSIADVENRNDSNGAAFELTSVDEEAQKL